MIKSNYRFALIGAAGYVAPRHMKAIKETNNELVAAIDPFDSVGIIDQYFPESAFFTQFERFDRHLEKLRRNDKGIDFLSICSPNYLHDAHCRFGLRLGADVICEKPLVLNPWNLEMLQNLEIEYQQKIYSILQLRLHPESIRLKNLNLGSNDNKIDVKLTYITSRGSWYYSSWKANEKESGGISTNIGIHLFDLLIWIFGPVIKNTVFLNSHDRSSGYLILERARIKWFLSINNNTIPAKIKTQNPDQKTYRVLEMKNETFDFSKGFENLHTQSYNEIIAGNGFGIEESFPSVQLTSEIRTKQLSPINNKESHELCQLKQTIHPFLN